MSTRLLLEGPDLESLLAKIKEEHGAAARIVSAERVRTGGLAGFFAKQRFEIAVDILDPDESPDDESAPPTADGLTALLARAEAQDSIDRPGARDASSGARDAARGAQSALGEPRDAFTGGASGRPGSAARFAEVLAERAGEASRRTIEPAGQLRPALASGAARSGVFEGLADATSGADAPPRRSTTAPTEAPGATGHEPARSPGVTSHEPARAPGATGHGAAEQRGTARETAGPGVGGADEAVKLSPGGPVLSEPSVAAKLAERARRRAAELAAEAAETEQRTASRRNGRIRIVSEPADDEDAPDAPATSEPSAGTKSLRAAPTGTTTPERPTDRDGQIVEVGPNAPGTRASEGDDDEDSAVTAEVSIPRPQPRRRTARGAHPVSPAPRRPAPPAEPDDHRPAATGRATVPPHPHVDPVRPPAPAAPGGAGDGDGPPTAVQPVRRLPPKPAARNGYDHPAVQLVRNGVPVHIAARAVGPDPWTAVARAVAGLPYPPAVPSRPGEVLVIVGDTEPALMVAGQIAALTAAIDPSATLVAGSIAGTGLRRSHRISSPDEAIRRSAELHSSAGPRIVVVEATAGSPIGRPAAVTPSADGSPRATIAALAPTQVWACVDATRKNADTARFLDALDRVDALAVHGADETVEPGSVLHFGLPVVMLDGRPATARRWTTLLCERLTGGPLPGDGPIGPIMPLELPAGHRGAHAAAAEDPVGSRRTTHRAPETDYVTAYEPPTTYGHAPTGAILNGFAPHGAVINGYDAGAAGQGQRVWWPEEGPGGY